MIKEAARTYRDAKGNKITAVEWIKQHGGAKGHPTIRPGRNGGEWYFDVRRNNEYIPVPKHFLTGDKKYNFSETSSKRIEIGRDKLDTKDLPKKTIKQNSLYQNRTAAPDYYDSHSYSSGFHNGVRSSFGDKAKEYVKADRERLKSINEELRSMINRRKRKRRIKSALLNRKGALGDNFKTTSKLPYGALGIGIGFTAGSLGYNAYKNRKRKDDRNERD